MPVRGRTGLARFSGEKPTFIAKVEGEGSTTAASGRRSRA